MYGANLRSESLPGGGRTQRHSSLQHLIQDMMRLGNIDSVLEAVNFFHGKVGQPFIGDYVHNITFIYILSVSSPSTVATGHKDVTPA